jgi:streptogramin lyase
MAAARAPLWYPDFIATDTQDNVYFSSAWRDRVFKISSATGQIALLAGSGNRTYGGDGAVAVRAGINPRGIAVDVSGNVFIADSENHRIRRVDALTGVITTVAGNGVAGFSGDGGPAVLASLNRPTAVAIDSSSNVYVADYSNYRIRRISPDGTITTVAGGGRVEGSAVELPPLQVGGLASESILPPPMALAIDSDGALLAVLDWFNQIIKLKPEGGTTKIELIAGSANSNNAPGADGDAATVRLDRPTAVSVDAKGDYYIVEGNGLRVRKVDRLTRTITTIAGTGQRGFFGDGGPAIAAWLDSPSGVAVDSAGNVLFADSSNNRLRVVHCVAEARTAGGSSCSAPSSSVTVGSRVLVTWSVTGVSSCLASGAWSGDKLAAGSEWVTLSAAGDKNFGLTCKSFCPYRWLRRPSVSQK